MTAQAEHAVRKVLALHYEMPIFEDAGDCAHAGMDDNPAAFESVDGVWLCGDCRADYAVCAECSHDHDEEPTEYPCPTVTAIRKAIGEES